MKTLILTTTTLITLFASSLLAADKVEPAPFQQTLALHGITFRVTTVEQPGKPAVLRLTPSGLKGDNSPVEAPLNGRVISAEIADLNIDRSPEVYVFVRLPGDGAGVSVFAWSANNNKSLSQIALREIPAGDERLTGYQGKDEFAIVESVLVRRFPVVDRMRQISYKLEAGEAGWILRPGRSTEF
jgi:hypothetical protein